MHAHSPRSLRLALSALGLAAALVVASLPARAADTGVQDKPAKAGAKASAKGKPTAGAKPAGAKPATKGAKAKPGKDAPVTSDAPPSDTAEDAGAAAPVTVAEPTPPAVETPAPALAITPTPAATPAATAREADVSLVAVLDLTNTNKEAAPLANALAAVITADIARRPGYRAVSRNELKAILTQKAEAAMLGCDSVACAADVAKLVDAQLVVSGTLERIEGSEAGPEGVAHVVTLSLIDATPAVVARATATWRGDPAEMVTLVPPLLDRLTGGAAAASYAGGLDVIAVDGARVFVDGKELGATPLKAPLGNLPIGVHVLELSRDGYAPVRKDVVVSRNENTVVRVEMMEEPYYTTWWFWTAIGGGTAVVVAAGATIGTLALLAGTAPPDTTLQVKTPLPATAR